ncbi:hypothetical protein WQ54_12240 [Bacillus sp. SA1-12]|uniref:hypothetical protein n=1 Tax=Bacillus sp. SA1-12 TaxID=1455638 RepID=UPI0006267844|nr:hypothetical protein [Bacillus sp. SA1-12]KKI91893.1 hypothetical protein WQ54_12240 [Bacillus sp. SA1-12]
MFDAFQLGPFTVQYFYIIVLITFLTTYYLIGVLVKESAPKQFIKKHYWTVVLILIFTYKFSIVLFRPELLWTNRWIYFTGGQKGIYLGFVISLVYLGAAAKKDQLSIKSFGFSLLLVTISYILLFHLIKIVVLSFA